MDSGYIIVKDPSDQDRKLDQICEDVRKAAQIDVHIISYHWTMIPIRRNGTALGRGGAVYTTFKLENDWKNLPVGMAGQYWDKDREVPQAGDSGLRRIQGCHGESPL